MTWSLTVSRLAPDAAPAALVATWLWADLIDLGGIRVDDNHNGGVVITATIAASDVVKQRVEKIFVHARFSGWALK